MRTLAEKVELLGASGIFDESWYVMRYPDVLKSAMSPAEHYVRVGQQLGRKPGPDQDAKQAGSFLAASRIAPAGGALVTDDLRDSLRVSRLFDEDWYRSHFSADLPSDVDALSDYLHRSASNPDIDPSALFSTTGYALSHPDAKRMEPLIHAATHGLAEGRSLFDPHKVNAFLMEMRSTERCGMADLLDKSQRVQVVVWNEGNFFFSEIAEYLVSYLRIEGFDASQGTDMLQARDDSTNVVVVAPHEFCVHGPGKAWTARQYAQAVYLNTEQWHTSWFTLSYKFLVQSNKAIDINPASASGLQAIGINTAFLPLLPLEQTAFRVSNAPISTGFATPRYIADLSYPDALAERPYDVLFVGAANARRETALGALAPMLSAHQTFVHCPRFDGPVRKGDPDTMSTSDFVQIARNSKILLNIHQGESKYFEWHRLFLFGLMEGCVVLTEPCIPNDYVKAGRDFLECDIADMPDRVQWLLESAEGTAEMDRIRVNCDRLRTGGADWMRGVA